MSNDSDLTDTGDVVRVVVKPRRAQPFFGRHPWVFESAIEGVESNTGEEPKAGTAVQLWSAEGRFIAHGLWNSASNIRVRLYSWQQSEFIDEDFLTARIRDAVILRRPIFDLQHDRTGCRLIFSEADNLSGLTVDFYGGYLLVQFTSLALYLRRELIVGILARELAPKGIWLRTEKGMREAEGLEAVDGLIAGEEPPRPLFIDAHGIQYGIDVVQGQKTGFYLDQRDNRLAASRFMAGRRVLDGFCFSGGFGITAVKRGGATTVLGIDSSESALKLATANAELNSVAEHCEFRRGDVRVELESLKEQGTTFDAVILDPPRMARSRGGVGRALKGYSRLNHAALGVLSPGGILVTCSCSGLVSGEDFHAMISGVAQTSERTIQILEQHSQPCDHPVSATCAETEYLKMLICRVL
ncbi:MAG: class I SAM-dependent rRNA methyltransferase [Fuerstiella sp.]|nr:class I SAM-dependent rRNA methyltransferase [Fuerstiella sp.]MCP4786862.1 class I SAM-dependent rRNA methyltransferase [Fuerstiella sp.]MCP4853364.1 class I SAM-dependent rRNA methyltransferase [Fuerstiella sp.]